MTGGLGQIVAKRAFGDAAAVEVEVSGGVAAAQRGKRRESRAMVMWRRMGLVPKAATCLTPLGWAGRRVRMRDHVASRDATACETCQAGDCPTCGEKLARRRWALTTLWLAQRLAEGWQAVFVSVAPQHRAGDDTDAVVAALARVVKLLTGGSFARRLAKRFGLPGEWVRRFEVSAGGWSGLHPNGHIVLLVPAVDDEHARAEELSAAIRSMIVKRAIRAGRKGGRAGEDVFMVRAVADEFDDLLRFTSEHAIDVRPAGVSVAGYVSKLDGAGIAGAAFELVDPEGTKSTVGRVGDRAAAHWAAQVAEDHGYSWRDYGRALVEVPDLAAVHGQLVEWHQIRRRRDLKLWKTADLIFAEWADWSDDELIAAALKVIDAEDLPAVRVALGLDLPAGPDDDGGQADDDDDEDAPFSPANCAASAMMPVTAAGDPVPEPPTGVRLLSLDRRGLEDAWLEQLETDPEPDSALCALVEREPSMMLGAYELVLAHLRATGELLNVYQRDPVGEATDRDPLHVTITEDRMLDDVPCWRRVPFDEVRRLAAVAPRWVHAADAEQQWAEERARRRAERRSRLAA